MTAKNELTVIVVAKDLCKYVLTVTEKSPKRFRFTLVSRMQNYSLDIIEHLYLANEVFAGNDEMKKRERLDYQHKALAELKLLGYVAQVSMEEGCILPKQYEQITKRCADCQNLTGAWINSDKRRQGR